MTYRLPTPASAHFSPHVVPLLHITPSDTITACHGSCTICGAIVEVLYSPTRGFAPPNPRECQTIPID